MQQYNTSAAFERTRMLGDIEWFFGFCFGLECLFLGSVTGFKGLFSVGCRMCVAFAFGPFTLYDTDAYEENI